MTWDTDMEQIPESVSKQPCTGVESRNIHWAGRRAQRTGQQALKQPEVGRTARMLGDSSSWEA